MVKIQKGALTQGKRSAPRRSANYICLRGTAVKSANIRQSRDKFASGTQPQIAKTISSIIYFKKKVKKFRKRVMEKISALKCRISNKLHKTDTLKSKKESLGGPALSQARRGSLFDFAYFDLLCILISYRGFSVAIQ